MKNETIQLGHGGGGILSRDLIRSEIVSRFGQDALRGLPDAATLPTPRAGALVFTTDSFVVQPLEFPGGNIGDLAVHGTVNDLAVCGGRPRWLSLALILEEGLPLSVLRRVLDSVKKAADACEVSVVTGDTKVVARGQCDGLYVNTAGIGELMAGYNLSPDRITGGDHLLVSGPLGDHGMAVLAAREAIRIENGPLSDSAPVHRLVMALQALAPSIRFMRDPTRGGLAAVTNEMVEERPFGLLLKETLLPFSPGARAVAELLGIDPLQVASEGRLVLVCDPAATESILALWRAMPEGRGAVRIGEVTGPAGRVVMETVTGGRRLVDVPRGELLPRIC
jgi:hydrogenase expression/formation protein HypE